MENKRKRSICFGLAGVRAGLLAAALFAAGSVVLEAQVGPAAPPIDVGAGSGGSFAFDWSGQYADGSPMAETTDVEFHFMPVPPITTPTGGDGHESVSIPLVAAVGANEITMKLALAGVPAGVYDLNVRLIGVGGNPSQYSTPVLSLRVRVKNPDRPTNVRVVGN